MKRVPQTIDYRQEFLEEVGSLDDFVIQPLDQHGDEFIEHLNRGNEDDGAELPWQKAAGLFQLRTSEVTLWAGNNGGGKTGILGQIMTHLALNGTKVLVASFEMPMKRLLERHCAQIEGRKLVKGQDKRFWEIMAMTDDNYWAFSQTSHMDPERVLGMISYSAREYGIKHFVIDCLAKCGVSRQPDHAENLERFVDAMQIIAKRYEIGVHLTLHMRKPPDHGHFPTKYDIKYAGELSDLADNVVLVWRNKSKEMGNDSPSPHDTVLIVDKQRHFTWEGMIGLNFNPESGAWYE